MTCMSESTKRRLSFMGSSLVDDAARQPTLRRVLMRVNVFDRSPEGSAGTQGMVLRDHVHIDILRNPLRFFRACELAPEPGGGAACAPPAPVAARRSRAAAYNSTRVLKPPQNMRFKSNGI